MSQQHSDTEAMERFRTALGKLENDTEQAFRNIELRIDAMRNTISDREKLWQTRLEIAENELEQAINALYSCENSGDSEHPPDCSAYRQAVYDAQRKVQECKNNIEICKLAAKTFETAVQEYNTAAFKYKNELATKVSPAQQYISKHNIIVESMPTHGDTSGGTSSGTTSITQDSLRRSIRNDQNQPQPNTQEKDFTPHGIESELSPDIVEGGGKENLN